jgi:hypothetical protein
MCLRSVFETAQLSLERHFGAVFSGLKISFPGNGDHKCRRRGSNAGTTWQEARASGAVETIRRARLRGEPLAFREVDGLRSRL